MRALARQDQPAAIPALLERANDWVPQVRAAATAALQGLLKDVHAPFFLQVLPALQRLQRQCRADHGALIAQIEALLIRPGHRALVQAALRAVEPQLARAAQQLCQRHALLDPATLVREALQHADPGVRREAIVSIGQLSAQSGDLLLQVQQDRWMPLRREALQQRMRLFPQLERELLKVALGDRSPAIREMAVLRSQRHGVDVLPLLQQRLQSPGLSARDIAGVLHAMQLCGSGAWPSIRGFATHASPAVREQVLRALSRLDPEHSRDGLLAALTDASPRVLRMALQGLLKQRQEVPLEVAQTTWRTAAPAQRQLLYVWMVPLLHKWDQLLFLLQVYPGDGSDAESGWLDARVRWSSNFNRDFRQPSVDQKAAISRLYEQKRALLGAQARRFMEFNLRFW